MISLLECTTCLRPSKASSGLPLPRSVRNWRTCLKSYAESFPDEFYWATGAQAPTLLHHLMMSIDMACTSNDKPRSIGWLAGRKPEGTA